MLLFDLFPKANAAMEAMDSQNHFNIIVIITFQPVRTVESVVREVFGNFNFHNESGILQFWVCKTDPDSEDVGCYLMLTDITCNPTQDQGLEDYRKTCSEKQYPFVGRATNVGNWSAGRAAQTLIADHRTTHHVIEQEDQHSEDVGPRGQLVLPVFYNDGTGNKPAGVIEYITPVPKECYLADFEQIHDRLKDLGLESTYMGKTIKVEHNGAIIRFSLPLAAKFTDLQTEVTKRIPELHHQRYRIEYNVTEGIHCPILSDEDLQFCMVRSSRRGAKFIRMFVLVEQEGDATKGLIRKSYGIAANTELLQA